MKSVILVFVQFLCIFLFFISGSFIPDNIILIVIQLLSFVIALLAILTIRIGNFQVLPDVKKNSKLVTIGIYKYIRHPMYSSLLLYFSSFLFIEFSIFRLIIFLVFFANMIVKLYYEEALLTNKFPEYVNYMKTSYRIIPFVF